MKILVLSFYFRPDLCAGSFRCTALMEQLSKRYPDAEFDLVTTKPNRYATFHSEAREEEIAGNVTIHRIPLPPHKSGMADQIRSFSAYYREAMRIVKGGRYDLVFATSSRLFTAFLGTRIARARRLPLYLDVRDLFVDTMSNILPAKIAFLAKPVLKIVERYTFGYASKINIVSKGFVPYFSERYPGIPLSCFTNGIDAEFLEDRKNGLPPHNFSKPVKVLYTGNIGEGQCLHSILPALAKRTEGTCVFKIVGDGGRKAVLRKSLADARVTNVELCDPVSRKDLIGLYREADVLFMHLGDYPAFKKVLPSKLFEYATTGKPMWAGVGGVAAELLESEVENVALFAPDDVDGAIASFGNLKMELKERASFVEKYTRSNIMADMADDIMSLARKH